MESMGVVLALTGAVLTAFFTRIGSAVGVGIAGEATTGAVTEDPNKFSRVLVLRLLPGTQGVYGLLIGFIALTQIGIMGGSADISLAEGFLYLAACPPMAFVGWFSAIKQSKAAVASIGLVTKKSDQFGKAMVFPTMVETYTILALLISILAVFDITGANV